MFIYNLIMWALYLLSPLAKLAGGKPKKWVVGRENLIRRTRELFKDNKDDIVWFHCASLGEFEQGRQLIDDVRRDHPSYKILITFYSPSGYEPRKNYPMADYVLYLPVDTPRAARLFVAAIKPKIVIFVKYEFWTNIIRECKKSGAKLYVISAILSKRQKFSRGVDSILVKTLRLFDHIFVQDIASLNLLKGVNINDVTVAGDTRFDRVYSLAIGAKVIDKMEWFATGGSLIFVAGSTWPTDDEIIIDMISKFPNMKFVIVPHELPQPKINFIKERCINLGFKTICYTEESDVEVIKSANVMIIDTIGILSSTYRYATMAYIGGGFGVGIHNTLEAATYGLPIAFGPNYKRFNEAVNLVSLGAAKSISNGSDLYNWTAELLANKEYLIECGDKSKSYVSDKIGATKLIKNYIFSKDDN